MKTIINLTQHKATPEQIADGVVDLPESYRKQLIELLTFNELPTIGGIKARARAIAELVDAFLCDKATEEETPLPKHIHAMIGGAPYLMAHLEHALKFSLHLNITALYAFSERISTEEVQPDGTIKKVSSFKHAGFIEVV